MSDSYCDIQSNKQKNHYRSKIQILAELLEVTSQGDLKGVGVSIISRRANLSHVKTLQELKVMEESGLVKLNQSASKKRYKITEKGLDFLEEIHKFHEMVKSLNLE